MLDEASVKQLVHDGKLPQTTRVLLCLAVGDNSKSVADIHAIGRRVGLSSIKKWNVSALLSASKGKAIRTDAGWELSASGRQVIEPLAGPLLTPGPPKAATSLRAQLPTIADTQTRAFVEEAISCVEHKEYRAAVVLSWLGAVSLLYDHVITNKLVAFNAEATKRNPKWKRAKIRDDLALMGEYDFLQILQTISVIGKNVKTELESALKLRNGCGHPSSLVIGENRVMAHVEILTLNVFAKF